MPAGGGSQRGRAPSYSTDVIADAAITVADDEGIDAVTMRRVAAVLGAGAMSLYRYVDSKESLFELMADRALGQEPLPELTGDWRDDLLAAASHQRETLLKHPWLLRLLSGPPSFGDNALAGFERTMSIVDGLGLDIDDMFETVGLIFTWVSGYVRNEIETRELFGVTDPEQKMQEAVTARVKSIVDSGAYPYFTRVVVEAKTPHFEPGARFERSLGRIIAGIEATLTNA